MLVRIGRRLRWPLLAAGVAALMSVSVAGATDNAPLVVAQTNGATQQTALQGSMASPVLLITNFNTGSGAYGLSVNGNSPTTPAIGGGNGSTGVGFRGLSTFGIGAQGIHNSASGTAAGVEGETISTAGSADAILGKVTSASPATTSSGVHGINTVGHGVTGQAGAGIGVLGTAVTGRGVSGFSLFDTGLEGFSGGGTSGTPWALNAHRSVNASVTPTSHVAIVDNTSTGTDADVLALRVGYTGNPTVANNYITFFKGGTIDSVGAIQGTGLGGVALVGPGNDYAEWLPKLHRSERLRPGDIVGLYAGRVTKATAGADRLLVVSTGPIVAGNDPGIGRRGGYARIALLGQATVRVRGPVAAGDPVVASGRKDGTGVAVKPQSASAAQLASTLGEAWTGARGPGLNKVRIAVGLGSSAAVQALSRQNRSLQNRLDRLERQVASLSSSR